MVDALRRNLSRCCPQCRSCRVLLLSLLFRPALLLCLLAVGRRTDEVRTVVRREFLRWYGIGGGLRHWRRRCRSCLLRQIAHVNAKASGLLEHICW
jgi:hypothetical protein